MISCSKGMVLPVPWCHSFLPGHGAKWIDSTYWEFLSSLSFWLISTPFSWRMSDQVFLPVHSQQPLEWVLSKTFCLKSKREIKANCLSFYIDKIWACNGWATKQKVAMLQLTDIVSVLLITKSYFLISQPCCFNIWFLIMVILQQMSLAF